VPSLCPFPECNLFHIGLGMAAAFFPKTTWLNVGLFVAYEVARDKGVDSKMAAMGQWGLGYAIGSLLC
jgi:hypothetical protein